MTEPVPASPTTGEPAKPPPPPLRPINLMAAAIIAALLAYNLHLDVSPDYDGARVTYGLIGAMCLALGLDFDRFWPRRGG